ncbi:hypothetical protein K438DRAFT_1984482 [Mycena galopus ATCC 62051]|nr:hypothetical protein K438DRAFT_1984482 [Mycena galopus ATCC 62051]
MLRPRKCGHGYYGHGTSITIAVRIEVEYRRPRLAVPPFATRLLKNWDDNVWTGPIEGSRIPSGEPAREAGCERDYDCCSIAEDARVGGEGGGVRRPCPEDDVGLGGVGMDGAGVDAHVRASPGLAVFGDAVGGDRDGCSCWCSCCRGEGEVWMVGRWGVGSGGDAGIDAGLDANAVMGGGIDGSEIEPAAGEAEGASIVGESRVDEAGMDAGADGVDAEAVTGEGTDGSGIELAAGEAEGTEAEGASVLGESSVDDAGVDGVDADAVMGDVDEGIDGSEIELAVGEAEESEAVSVDADVGAFPGLAVLGDAVFGDRDGCSC